MRTAVALLALTLAGCASAPRPQVHVVSHPKPVVQAPVEPAPTFKDRFRKFRGKLRWVH